jgi:acyl-CoA reductase-like NAD-dependent aldehyde dehydrogenase
MPQLGQGWAKGDFKFRNNIHLCLAINNIDDWTKRDYVPKNMINKVNTIYNIYEPLGVSLIIGAWNYPTQLTFGPLLAAIAAGNTCSCI